MCTVSPIPITSIQPTLIHSYSKTIHQHHIHIYTQYNYNYLIKYRNSHTTVIRAISPAALLTILLALSLLIIIPSSTSEMFNA
jgi:hypothetical protein